jgi:pimeloyl-ACP methyl ester carboxylesterase
MKPQNHKSREAVVVLHGFGGSPIWMSLLCRRVSRSGRRVVNWGYASWRRSISASADRLIEQIHVLEQDGSVERIHFVAYSMGSIICRAALVKRNDFSKLGRVVMLGPPNRGSHVASFFSPLVGRLLPAVRELSTCPKSFVNSLPRLSGVQVGVIAAQRDRIVRFDNTHLPCQREHLEVPGGHSGLILRREVARLAMQFVGSGSFATETETASAIPVVAPTLGVALSMEQTA